MPFTDVEQRRAYHRLYQAKWRCENLAKCRAIDTRSQKKNAVRNVATARELKNVPCQDCGHRYPPYVMDFDHVRGVKRFAVSTMDKHSVAILLEEIKKCDVVCANCHRIRTWNRKHP